MVIGESDARDMPRNRLAARQAAARTEGARVQGTPSLMVNGKYRIDTRQAGSQANMLKIAAFLADKELARLERAANAAD